MLIIVFETLPDFVQSNNVGCFIDYFLETKLSLTMIIARVTNVFDMLGTGRLSFCHAGQNRILGLKF